MQAVTFVIAFIVVLALIAGAAWLVRRFAGDRLGVNANRGRMPRLAVIDAAAVDGRRRLVLVRRDNVEHLLMIGGPTDIVVEQNIVRASSGRDQAPQRPLSNETPRLPPLAETGWSESDSARSDPTRASNAGIAAAGPPARLRCAPPAGCRRAPQRSVGRFHARAHEPNRHSRRPSGAAGAGGATSSAASCADVRTVSLCLQRRSKSRRDGATSRGRTPAPGGRQQAFGRDARHLRTTASSAQSGNYPRSRIP